jgi:ribose transport system permease protein
VIAAMLAAGAIVGSANATLSVRFGITSVISTLGIGIMLTGFTAALSGGKVLFEGIPLGLINFGSDKFLGISDVAWATLVVALVLVYVLEHTPFGRRLYATGASERVAFLAGVKTKRMKFLAFVIAGLMMGAAAIAQLATTGSASPSFGPELLLPAYAGAFLSVVAYRPGYFNVPGAVIAIVLIAVGNNGLSLLGVPYWGQPLFNGAVLIVAVLSARSESRRVRIG